VLLHRSANNSSNQSRLRPAFRLQEGSESPFKALFSFPSLASSTPEPSSSWPLRASSPAQIPQPLPQLFRPITTSPFELIPHPRKPISYKYIICICKPTVNSYFFVLCPSFLPYLLASFLTILLYRPSIRLAGKGTWREHHESRPRRAAPRPRIHGSVFFVTRSFPPAEPINLAPQNTILRLLEPARPVWTEAGITSVLS